MAGLYYVSHNHSVLGVTLYSVGFSNLLVTALMLPYLVLAWVFTVRCCSKEKIRLLRLNPAAA